jgi:nicotinate-nucleotide adenylyltransferase
VGAVTGVLGGAFDPPHVGHVALARGGVDWFGLERLLVRVVADPGHKHVTAGVEDRLVLARLGFAEVDVAEIEIDAHARTIDSLEHLALIDPVFLVGADEFASFLDWRQPERVLELARLGVASRPGVSRDRLHEVLDRLDRPDRVAFFEIPPFDVSSSSIRERIASGDPIDGLVPPAVAAEIERRGLYRDAVRTPRPG